MRCVCGCPDDEHDELGPCDLSKTDPKHLCGGYDFEGEE
jgi:hypothetical protein